MRHTEFWARMEAALGNGYARTWAEQHTLTELGSRTALEALEDGVAPKAVWEAVWENLGLSLRDK